MKPKRIPRDPNQQAFLTVQIATGQVSLPEEVKTQFAEFGAEGGKKRAKSLSAKKRSEIAKKAARTRWKKAKPKR